MSIFQRPRSPRNIEDLLDDPNFRFNVYRHIGASEMIAHWLLQQEDPQAKMFGEKLGRILGYFFEPKIVQGPPVVRKDPWEDTDAPTGV